LRHMSAGARRRQGEYVAAWCSAADDKPSRGTECDRSRQPYCRLRVRQKQSRPASFAWPPSGRERPQTPCA
jgi:hypothetical protein